MYALSEVGLNCASGNFLISTAQQAFLISETEKWKSTVKTIPTLQVLPW